jgi:hypothetical protein
MRLGVLGRHQDPAHQLGALAEAPLLGQFCSSEVGLISCTSVGAQQVGPEREVIN